MDLKSLLWYAVLSSLTGAYLVALAGFSAARAHDVAHHSRRMIIACTIVGVWLVAYVMKQSLFGRERFGGTNEEYWWLYAPLFATHMLLAVTTICLGAYNLYMGIYKLRYGSVGAMAAGVTHHRMLGKVLIWSFTGTMITAYLVFMMLFVWYQA